jgi:hypothetical protein
MPLLACLLACVPGIGEWILMENRRTVPKPKCAFAAHCWIGTFLIFCFLLFRCALDHSGAATAARLRTELVDVSRIVLGIPSISQRIHEGPTSAHLTSRGGEACSGRAERR